MDKKWTDEAWEDYLSLQSDKRLLKKANELLKDIDRNGYAGLGKPEPLKADLSGYWSRRIDDYNRIVYMIHDTESGRFIEIVQCGSHYHK
ncbi:MAG: Txe/YoeB family addiction module toxin [Treponema sp.]|nr:Txe/YoeB family addiction module toxin [Treponema sp.]